MESVILLNKNENTRKIEGEEKARFTQYIFEMLGLPLHDVLDENGFVKPEEKIKYNNILSSYSIEILDNIGEDLEIYLENKLIAKWEKPNYVLKKDCSQINPRKKLYLEMHLNYWSVLEENEKNNIST